MDVPSVFGARRLCELAGRACWVRPIDWRGWADILAWLDDVLPGKSDRELPPLLGAPASQAALRSDPGRALLAWIAVRDQGVGYDEASRLWHGASDEERTRLVSVLLTRRRTLMPTHDAEDLAETWLGEAMARLAVEIGMEAISRLTLDQTEWLLSDGECDKHAEPGLRNLQEAQRLWEEKTKRQQEQQDGGVKAEDQ